MPEQQSAHGPRFTPGYDTEVDCIFPYITPDVRYFILGGPADNTEAQELHVKFPDIRVIGFEPNRDYFKYQIETQFPGKLYPDALSDEIGESNFYIMGSGEGRSSRLEARHAPAYRVRTVTIDSLGIEEPVALWLDIERSEYKALMGASWMFRNKLVRVCLIEILPGEEDLISKLLQSYGMKEAERVNVHKELSDTGVDSLRYDGIYVPA